MKFIDNLAGLDLTVRQKSSHSYVVQTPRLKFEKHAKELYCHGLDLDESYMHRNRFGCQGLFEFAYSSSYVEASDRLIVFFIRWV